MIIESVRIKNFRSIRDEELNCDSLTVLVGRNGAGKSSFLHALQVFYEPKMTVSPDDFYAGNSSDEIEIAVKFGDLNSEEKEQFAAYLDGDTLTVARVFCADLKSSGKYHGMKMQNSDFAGIRNASSGKRNRYDELRKDSHYAELRAVRNAKEVDEALTEWESANPDRCERMRDAGQFFGFTGVAQGYLGRYTRFVLIPAVRDASEDASEGKGSGITEIMDLVVRQTLASKPEVVALRNDTQTRYGEIMDPAKLSELGDIQEQLSTTFRQFAPEAGLALNWEGDFAIDFPLPKAEVKIHEDGYASSVQRCGHGIQRAFVLAMLQHLAAAKSVESVQGDDDESLHDASRTTTCPDLILAIEEPELYQHPSRQRHMASVLSKLAIGTTPGVAERTQVIYTTHSPLFVGLDRFDQIRLLRKEGVAEDRPKITRAIEAALDAVANEIWIASGEQGERFAAATLRPRLQTVMTPWVNEGFFADAVVLVEGEGDRAAILGAAGAMGHDFDGDGIAVIPCGGKNSLDKPLVIFRGLGIPVYVVWDGDCGKSGAKAEDNRQILRLLSQPEEDWPSCVSDRHACFKTELETTLAEDIGRSLFEQLLSEEQTRLGIAKKGHALKNVVVLKNVVEKASQKGQSSKTLMDIIEKIVALRHEQRAGQ